MIVIYQQDCIEFMKCTDYRPNIVVTSPPYNLNIKYNSYSDNLDNKQYLEWVRDWSKCIYDIMDHMGSFFLNVGYTAKNPQIPFQVYDVVSDIFHTQNIIHWVKSITINDKSIGHFKPVNSDRFLNQCHEFIFHFTKTNTVKLDKLAIGVTYTDKSNISRFDHDIDKRDRGNVWYIPYETVQDTKSHPAAFPVLLPEYCIKLHGVDDCTVYDPFTGSGSTAVACQRLGVDFIGTEIDSKYIDIANDRLDGISLLDEK